MKGIVKKFFNVVLACSFLIGSFSLLSACKSSKKDDSPSSEEENVFELDYHVYNLSLYDTFQLSVVEWSEEVTWSSDNDQIVEVDADGVIYAVGYGAANITATSGNYTDTCIVTVTDEGLVPSLTTAVDGDALSLFVADTFALNPSILFNGVSYDDLTVSYEVADKAKAEVDKNGVITAKELGSTTISLKAEWRGFNDLFLNETITLTVVPDISIEMTAGTQEIFTVQEQIDGEQYENKTTLDWRILLKKQDVTDSASVTFEVSNPSVLSVNADGEITGLMKGSASVVLVYTLEGTQYRSLPLEIKVSTPEKQLVNAPLCYNVNTFEEIAVSALEGAFVAVRLGNTDYTESAEYENGNLTISDDSIKNLRGEQLFKIETTKYTYTVPTVFATHLIGTFEEYKTFHSSYTGGVGDTNKSDSWYVVLTDNINCNGETLSKAQTDHFAGTFNGLGHVISNVCVSGNNTSLFGGLNGTTVIENLGLLNIVGKSSNCYLLAGYFYGSGATVRNIYLKGEFTVPTTMGFARQGNSSKIVNCIVDITYPDGSDESVAIATEGSKDYISNTYAIGNAANFATSYVKVDGNDVCVSDSRTVYATAREFVTAHREEINAENGWSKYWSQDGMTVYFGGMSIMPLETARTATKLYKKDAFTVNVSEYLTGAVQNVYINDRPVDVNNNVVTVNPSEYIVGSTNKLCIFGETDSITIPFVAVTYAIGNAEQMKAFLESYATTDKYATTGTKSDGWYVVLTADVDMSGYERNINNAGGTTWSGTFNGLGHTVSNIKVYQGGLFGRLGVGAVIENTAFVGINSIKDWYVLCNQADGNATIRNLYLEGESTTGEAVLIRGSKSRMAISNVIINFTNNGTKDNVSIFEEQATLTNVYGIGDIDKIKYSGTATGATLYEDVTTFFNTEQANIKSENGWNEYWAIREGSLYFGTTKVE